MTMSETDSDAGFSDIDPLPGTVEVAFYTSMNRMSFARQKAYLTVDVDLDGRIDLEKKDEILKALEIELRTTYNFSSSYFLEHANS